ncbi:MAG: terpene cyclase/mutase family protein [Planctomycetes bacterium]|nr:terpene cyclase/mutase family protein [Planctomycetota bacterium]
MMNQNAVLRISLSTLALLFSLPLAATGQSQDDGTYKTPSKQLDPRIDPEKLTQQDPPALEQQLILPMPANFRIAKLASEVPISVEHWKEVNQSIELGLKYLRANQETTGAWAAHIKATTSNDPNKPSPISVAITALAVKSIIQAQSQSLEDETLQKAIAFIRSAQNDNGSFEGGVLTSYVTSLVVMALASTDEPDFHGEIADATRWLKKTQWDQSEGLSANQDWFGGAGYGKRGRPDLSNTQTMLDALYESGISPDEPAMKRALAFLSRAQNLKATNKADWAGNDGGFIYTPANGGESFANEYQGEGRFAEKIPAGQARSLRSYGSMTYAGFKSMIYAGLSPDDIRVRAAFDWIKNHWTFEENPGVGQQGLYYYYHTMSRALRVAQQHTITDANGIEHNWREELIEAITSRQREDGSWKNSADRWLEAEPVMASVFAILALEEAIKPTISDN